MPNRVIKESIKTSAEIDSLTWFEEVVFYRLIVTADDYGCLDGRPVYLKNTLFPTKENVTRKAVEDAIDRLASVGLIVKYESSGMPFLFFPSWEKHQRIRNKHRKYPEPDVSSLTANRGQMTASRQSESESNPNPNPNPRGNARPAARFTPPTVEEVEAYCRERGNNVDAQRFVDYYASKGWVVGKAPMKDWRACVRTWERDDSGRKVKPIAQKDPALVQAQMDRMQRMMAAMPEG
jgi:hypothetical protein